MTLTNEEQRHAAAHGHYSEPRASKDDDDDTDDERGVYPAVRAGGTCFFRRAARGNLAHPHEHARFN